MPDSKEGQQDSPGDRIWLPQSIVRTPSCWWCRSETVAAVAWTSLQTVVQTIDIPEIL